MNKTISKHVFEIKFSANSPIIDKRGEIAAASLDAQFTDWKINENAVEFSKKGNENFGAYISYKGIGLYSTYPNKTPFFKKNTKKFIKKEWEFMGDSDFKRIGVRSTFLTEVEDYQETFRKFKKKFLNLDDDILSKFGGDFYDLAIPMNFVDGNNYFNINIAPIYQEQSKQIFSAVKDLPKYGILVDVDFFRKDVVSSLSQRDILDIVNAGVQKAKEIHRSVLERLDS